MSSMVRPCQRSIQQNTCLKDMQNILLCNFGLLQEVGGLGVAQIAFLLQYCPQFSHNINGLVSEDQVMVD
jgi:hypothetical protein